MDNNFYQQLLVEEGALEKQIGALQEQVAEKTKTLDAVRVLKNRYNAESNFNDTVTPSVTSVIIKKVGRPKKGTFKENFPLEYEKGLTHHQAIYAATHTLEKAFSDEIAKQLTRFDPDKYPEEKALGVARECASELYIKGVLGAKKYGRKHKYYIKQKATV